MPRGAPSNPLNLRTDVNVVVVDNGDEKTIEEINTLYGVYAAYGVPPYTFSNNVETIITDWTKAGDYTITLNVVDKLGGFDDKDVKLTISEAGS